MAASRSATSAYPAARRVSSRCCSWVSTRKAENFSTRVSVGFADEDDEDEAITVGVHFDGSMVAGSSSGASRWCEKPDFFCLVGLYPIHEGGMYVTMPFSASNRVVSFVHEFCIRVVPELNFGN